jgi:glyoxylase-like metal-dependent hydrolase (beta-lactamase superfamily II)
MRCLLIEDGQRLILIDNGMGNKQDEKFMGHYYLHGADTLDNSLKKLGYHANDITDVVLTHLHFDHCGGSVKWKADRSGFELSFPNAHYWIGEEQFNWAYPHPNAREKASFLKDNILPIYESGHVKLVKPGELVAGLEVLHVYGHTEGMMLPLIPYQNRKILYAADLTPSSGHIPLPYVMAYDMRPLQTLEEKGRILGMALAEDWLIYLEHDPIVECISLQQTDKGARVKDRFSLSEL